MSASAGERLRPRTIIWGAMLGGTVAYTAVATLFARPSAAEVEG